jgi:hypothetical protein
VMTDPVLSTTGVPTAPAIRNTSLLFELTLRTLGDVRGSAGVN